MIIAVEGIDGAGKTSVSKKLSEKLGFTFIEKALKNAFSINKDVYISLRESLKSYAKEKPDVMAMFFLLNNAVCNVSAENIIADRYLMTNYFFYGNEKNKLLYTAFLEVMGKPNYTVVLTADNDTLKKRIKSRGLSKAEEEKELRKVNQNIRFDDKVVPFLEECGLKYIVIDTSNLSADETTEIILNKLII